MSIHHLCVISYNTLCLSKMYLILLLLLGNGLHIHLWIKSTEALPVTENKCKNNLVVLNSGMFDLRTDVYNLKNVWSSCQVNNSGKYGRDPNSEVWKVCRSAACNLQMLCNLTLPEQQISKAESIWKLEDNGTNICQGIYIQNFK